MGILDIEDRIVARGFHDLGEIKIHLRVGLAGQHGEPHCVLADFLDHIGDGDKIARAFGHFFRFAIAQQPHHLHQLHVELGLALGQRCHRCLDPLDGAAVIRAPDVDQLVCRLCLLEMIGKIAAEIGPATIGFLDRPILIIAKLRRPEQRQLDRFPILDHLALGLLEHAVIDQIARPQFRFGGIRLARFVQFGLGRENIVPDAEQGEIRADHVHHPGDRRLAEDQQPFGFRSMLIFVAKFCGQGFADRLQIITGVKPLGDRANVVTKRFPITQMRRAGERIDLRSGIIDIIFADHLVADRLE